MLGPIFRRIFVTFLLIVSIALFACLSEVGTMKTHDAQSYISIIKLLSLAGTGDKIFLYKHGHLFCPQCTCVFYSFLLMGMKFSIFLALACLQENTTFIFHFLFFFSFFLSNFPSLQELHYVIHECSLNFHSCP